MPQKYTHCMDCQQPKTTYGQQKSLRCNACAGEQKRADKGEYYTSCVDCGAKKPLGASRRSPRCRACAYNELRKHEYFDVCQECGKPKGLSKSRLCRSCSFKVRKATFVSKVKTYPHCQECDKEKANTPQELCHSCSTRNTWDTKRQRILTWYDTCQGCGKDKPRTDRELCLSCAGVKRMTEMYPDTDREYPYGWSDNYRESIRERDGHKCQLCGKTGEENGRKLDVHHIDYDKSNLDPANLLSLCMSCHPKTNWNHNFWIQVFTEYRGRKPKQDWQHRVVVSAVKGGLSVAV